MYKFRQIGIYVFIHDAMCELLNEDILKKKAIELTFVK